MGSNYGKDMYRQMEELFEKVDALNKTVKRLETENREKEEQLRRAGQPAFQDEQPYRRV
jgi:hypothetical protein